MRSFAVMHSAHLRGMNQVDGHEKGTKIQNDRKSEVMLSPPKITEAISAKSQLTNQKKKQMWRVHQPICAYICQRCCWARCPSIKKSKAKESKHMIQATSVRNALQRQGTRFICAIPLKMVKG